MMVCSVRNRSVEQFCFIGSAYIVSSLKAAALLTLLFALAGCAGSGPGAPIFGFGGSDASSSGGEYTVVAGDTLSKISRSSGVSVSTLMSLNNISDPRQLRVGQRLRLGTASASGGMDRGGDMDRGDSDSSAPAKPLRTRAQVNAADEKASEIGNPSRASNANVLNLQWPAKGKVIEGFSSSNKGIDIEGPMGEPIFAAADGKVEFADNGGRGLGNLVILSHNDGFITAYAHNQNLAVKTGERVKKGAKIATMGQTEASSPRLHFEVRRNGTALDPLRYLPPQ